MRSQSPPICWPSDAVDFPSTPSVRELADRLTEAGCWRRVEGRIAPTRKFVGRPVVGSACASVLVSAPNDDIGLLFIEDYLVDDPNRCLMPGTRRLDAGRRTARRGCPRRAEEVAKHVERRCRGGCRWRDCAEVPTSSTRATLPEGGRHRIWGHQVAEVTQTRVGYARN